MDAAFFISLSLGMFFSGFYWIVLIAGIGLSIAVVKKMRGTGGWMPVFLYSIRMVTPLVLLLAVYWISDKMPFRPAGFWVGILSLHVAFSIMYVVHLRKIATLGALRKQFVTAIKTEFAQRNGS